MNLRTCALRCAAALALVLAASFLVGVKTASAQTAPAQAEPTPTAPAQAEPAPTAPVRTLQVYTKPIEPFSFQKDDKAAGYSLDLWERVAAEAKLPYELHWVKTAGELVDAVKNNQADVGIAAVSITSDREAVVDFSTPYYESGLGILVNAQGKSILSIVWDSIWSATALKFLLVLVAILLIIAHLVWFFERKQNAEQFPEPYLKGIWESSWWALATILSGGCDAKGPVAVVGRIAAAIWMLVCIIVITYFTAAITTVMTVNQLTSDINGPSDLPGLRVATVKGSTADKYLTAHGSTVVGFDTIADAFAALDKKDVKAVVYDEPILRYHVKVAGGPSQEVVGQLFERQNYGIALQQNSPYRKAINGALLKLREDGVLDELRSKWFGDE
jgi:ABC-type amino acid transport substrate-binding protein